MASSIPQANTRHPRQTVIPSPIPPMAKALPNPLGRTLRVGLNAPEPHPQDHVRMLARSIRIPASGTRSAKSIARETGGARFRPSPVGPRHKPSHDLKNSKPKPPPSTSPHSLGHPHPRISPKPILHSLNLIRRINSKTMTPFRLLAHVDEDARRNTRPQIGKMQFHIKRRVRKHDLKTSAFISCLSDTAPWFRVFEAAQSLRPKAASAPSHAHALGLP